MLDVAIVNKINDSIKLEIREQITRLEKNISLCMSDMARKGLLRSGPCVNKIMELCVTAIEDNGKLILQSIEKHIKSFNINYSDGLADELKSIAKSHSQEAFVNIMRLFQQMAQRTGCANKNLGLECKLTEKNNYVMKKLESEIDLFVLSLKSEKKEVAPKGEEKDTLWVIRCWNYISNNPLLSIIIGGIVVGIFIFLISRPPKDKNETILTATKKGDYLLVKNLLAEGADVNATNNYGETLLHLASAHKHVKVVQVLLNYDAFIDPRNEYGETPLYLATAKNSIALAKVLLANGANINARNDWDVTPLLFAVEKNKFDMVKFLLGKGADVKVENNDGKTALMIARERGFSNMIDLLRKAEAKK